MYLTKLGESGWHPALLTEKTQAAYACMNLEKIGNYDELKKAILRRYDITKRHTGNVS